MQGVPKGCPCFFINLLCSLCLILTLNQEKAANSLPKLSICIHVDILKVIEDIAKRGRQSLPLFILHGFLKCS